VKHCQLGLPHSRRGQCNRGDESGFTVVELVIALALMAIVMAGLAPAIDGALQAAATTNHRTEADGLAVAAIEQWKSIPYAEVGFSGPAPAYCTTANPASPFNAYATADTAVTTAQPNSLVTNQTLNFAPDSVQYTVQSCVYWANASISGDTDAYKQTVAAVSWTDSAGAHAISEESVVYDCGQPYAFEQNSCKAAASSAPAGDPAPPTALVATTGDYGTVNLAWVPPALTPVPVDHYLIEYNTTGVFGASGAFASLDGGQGLTYSVGGLTPGSIYYFQVLAVAAGGGQSSPSNVAYAPAGGDLPSGLCVVNSLNVTPTTGVVDHHGNLLNGTTVGTVDEFSLSVNATPACNSVQVQYADASGTQYATVAGTSGQLTGTTLPTSIKWNVGTDPFVVYVGGVKYSPLTEVLVNVCLEKGSTGTC